MMMRRLGGILALAAMLAGCGGGGSTPVATPGPTTTTPVTTMPVTTTPTPTPSPTAGCSLRDRQDWVLAQMREWYLFPETLPASLDPAGFTTVDTYLDALTATARSQRRDRYFTYLNSIREEDAYYDSGASAGFGLRLALDAAQTRLMVTEAFEGAPALAAGIDRGAAITGIGTTSANVRPVSAILASGGYDPLTTALGPDTPGTTRVLRLADGAGGTRDVTVAKADFALSPVSARYGTRILDDAGQKVGYVNLRTFISTADPALRTAFGQFRAAGVTRVIVDLRYNGGGLLSTAEVLTDLLGAARTATDVQSYISFRPEKAATEDSTRLFRTEPDAIAPMKIAFIGTGGTASASEYVINAFIPYLRADSALIGTNTYGKPVGQIALDRSSCDDRLRVIAFSLQNSARQGVYYDGLAASVGASCRAEDDLTHPLGDAQETSVARALDFLAGRSCTPISGSGGIGSLARTEPAQTLLVPARPAAAQRAVPGLF